MRNVIERLATIRRERSPWAQWSSRKSLRLNPNSKGSSTISECFCSHSPETLNSFKVLFSNELHGKQKRKHAKTGWKIKEVDGCNGILGSQGRLL
jgi:hypothetical protein